jgi:hypothetical protein
MPLFEFLSIPDPLKRQFKLPQGCVISPELFHPLSLSLPHTKTLRRSVALRKVKTLGLRKNFRVIRPGDLGCLPPRAMLPLEVLPPAPPAEEEEQEDTAEYPPFEPLVLWSNPEDSTKKIEVSFQDFQLSLTCLGYSSAGLPTATTSTGGSSIPL